MSLPFFSVIIPSYNHAQFIEKCIDSVVQQTFENWEIIIVDNFSTDQTKSIVEKYLDDRINYYEISNFGVIAKSRNFGIQKALGQYIAFLDSDDLWFPSKLSSVYTLIQIENPDIIYHDVEIIDRQSNVIGNIQSRQLKKETFHDLIVTGNIIVNSSAVVKKSALESIGFLSERRSLVGSEDFHAWLKLANQEFVFRYLNKRLGQYRSHTAQVSNFVKGIKSEFPALEDFLGLISTRDLMLLRRNVLYSYGRSEFMNANYLSAKLLFRQAVLIRVNLIDFKALTFYLISAFLVYAKKLIDF